MQNRANMLFIRLTCESVAIILPYQTENIHEYVESNSSREKLIVSNCHINPVGVYYPVESMRFKRICDAATNCSSYYSTFSDKV